jgi:hypothetical protein
MDSIGSIPRRRRHTGMSYKFQRLREKIRHAVTSGELSGKLPGERELARRFNVNAKTLSKALTDLAAEGLLHRSIGRGTFVKGAAPEEAAGDGRWLLVVDPGADQGLISQLRSHNAQIEMTDDPISLRPSYLSQFAAVVDLAGETPESFLRDLLVRNIPIVTVGREPRTYTTNAVIIDVMLGASYLTRDLILAGHRRFLALESRNRTNVAEAVRRTAARYCDDFSVDACFPKDVACGMDYGATACICDSVQGASEAMDALANAGVNVPQGMSVAAVGTTGDDCPCTGYYVSQRNKASAVVELLRHAQPGRPTVLWLAGAMMDRGTIANLAAPLAAEQAAEEAGLEPSRDYPILTLAQSAIVG